MNFILFLSGNFQYIILIIIYIMMTLYFINQSNKTFLKIMLIISSVLMLLINLDLVMISFSTTIFDNLKYQSLDTDIIQNIVDVLYYFSSIIILSYFIKAKINSFIKTTFIIALSLRLLFALITTLSFVFEISFVREIFYPEVYNQHLMLTEVIVNYLIVYLFFISMASIFNFKNTIINNLDIKAKTLSTLLLFICTLGLYFPVWTYQTIVKIKKNFNIKLPYSENLAVFLLFIPVVNIFWLIYLYFSIPLIIKKAEKLEFNKIIGFNYRALFIAIFLSLIFILQILAILNVNINGGGNNRDIAIILNLIVFPMIIYTFAYTQAKLNILISLKLTNSINQK